MKRVKIQTTQNNSDRYININLLFLRLLNPILINISPTVNLRIVVQTDRLK